jgi:hypothetical protein
MSVAAARAVEFQTEKPDWALFRTLDGLGQKAGVAPNCLRRLVLKELVDNGLDTGARVTIKDDASWYIIEDNGPGMDGTPQQVADLFSIDRALRSSKQLRKPRRGALGNGLRVVAGAIIASGGGHLTIWTRDQRLTIAPLADGGSAVKAESVDFPTGTKIQIAFGPHLPQDPDALSWARAAIVMSWGGLEYDGKTSPHWYDAGSFYELVHWSGRRPVRDLVANLDGCTGAKAALVTGDLKGCTCESLTRRETTALLIRARAETTPPNVKKLGSVGEIEALPRFYSRKTGFLTHGPQEPKARLPFVVEAWAEASMSRTTVSAHVNRTPITGEVRIGPAQDGKSAIWGCGLGHLLDAPKKGGWRVLLNVTIPFMPITTDGKEPNLELFAMEIVDAVESAIKRAKRAAPKSDSEGSIKDFVFEQMADAVSFASGGMRVGTRQVLYVLRPRVWNAFGRELTTGNFEAVLTDYENQFGEIAAIYRDNRGVLYEPWSDGNVPLGTLMAERYSRPPWRFNKLLFIEKEGFFEALKSERWPETYDCALMTSKGYATRAAKDLIDLLAEHDEPITIFCAHDADSAGTMIYQTLRAETRARGARSIEIIDLGLQPWEARAMGLESESFAKGRKERPVADYVKARSDGAYWAQWLQSNRYELNAMTMPQFLGWITEKIEPHNVGKVVPPRPVIEEEADLMLEDHLREQIKARILREANIDAQVAVALERIERPGLTPEQVKAWLNDHPVDNWRGCVEKIVTDE